MDGDLSLSAKELLAVPGTLTAVSAVTVGGRILQAVATDDAILAIRARAVGQERRGYRWMAKDEDAPEIVRQRTVQEVLSRILDIRDPP